MFVTPVTEIRLLEGCIYRILQNLYEAICLNLLRITKIKRIMENYEVLQVPLGPESKDLTRSLQSRASAVNEKGLQIHGFH